MRIGIYDRYWSTLGGGERYAGTMIEALKGRAEVDLIGVEPLDLHALGGRLDLDFTGARFVRWPALPCARLTPLTRRYDVFVNSTYGSSMRSQARRSIYVVLFPHKLSSPLVASLQRVVRGLVHASAPWQLRLVGGYYDPEATGVCWTGPDAWLRLSPRAFRHGMATLRLRAGVGPTRVVQVNGPITGWSAGPDHLRVTTDRIPTEPVEIHVRSEPFVPRDLGLGDDGRQLGLCLELGSARGLLGGLGRSAGLTRTHRDFLGDYAAFLAISEYTRAWVKRRWGRNSYLLPPPVDTERFRPRPGAEKQRVILSVGRFFAARGGHHNKKHIEMLRAFREMCDRGLVPAGWEYRLAGRVHHDSPQHMAYFDEVSRLAAGYPVRILADISYDELAEEYRGASIFWHAAGLGEDDSRYPERSEHFGITTCEAMCAGCIPVVIAKAGQVEIVTDSVDGHTFRTADELMGKTSALMASFGTSRNAWMAEAARRAAKRYAKQVFVESVHEVLLSEFKGA